MSNTLVWKGDGTAWDAYQAAKQLNPEHLVIVRLGGFYKLFLNDATIASKILGIPAAGFPHHQLDWYLQKLVKAGHQVVIVERPNYETYRS